MGTTPGRPNRKGWPIALVTGGLLLGGATVGAVGVAAADAAPQLTAATPALSGSSGAKHHGTETPVTGTKAATLKAAALKAVPGATVLRVETDADGAAYEVHLKKADGTFATVTFDSALKQTGIDTDTGHGRHGGHRDHDRSTTTE